MNIGEKYEVIFGENNDGSFEKETMTLEKIGKYKEKEVYIFRDDNLYDFVQYNHNGNIDWDFVEEINEVFIG